MLNNDILKDWLVVGTAYLCIGVNGCFSEGGVSKLPLPAPDGSIAHKQPVSGQAAAGKECCPLLQQAPDTAALRCLFLVFKSPCTATWSLRRVPEAGMGW